MILLELETQMYRKAGVLKGPGRGLSNSEQVEGLHIINSLIDGLKIERLFFYQIVRTIFATIIGQRDYKVGPLSSGVTIDWDIERPSKILRAGFIVPPSTPEAQQVEIPMNVFLSYEQYQLNVAKNIGSTLPLALYYRITPPVGTATLWPVPAQVGEVAIYTPGVVQEFNDIMDEVQFPDGYREFLEYAGAVAVNDNYPEAKMKAGVEKRAGIYKARIKANQFQPTFIGSDPAAVRRSDGGYGTTWLDVVIGPGGGSGTGGYY